MAGLKTIIALSFVRLPAMHEGLDLRQIHSAKSCANTNIMTGLGDRVSPRHPLFCALQELPHPPRSRNLCDRTPAELDLWARSKSG